jgi:hypothetical protein
LEPLRQAELQFTSRDDFQHLMLGMIAKLSPCSEERLLHVVAGQAGRKSLRSRNKTIRESVRELRARRFVDIIGHQLVVTNTGRRHLQIKSFMTPMESPTSSVKVVGTKQRQDVEAWNEVASEFEKAVVALRTAEPDTPGESPSELSSQRNLDAVADLGCAAQEEAPFELSPDLALLDAGIAQKPLLKLEEKLPSPVTERHGLGSGEPVLLNQIHAWSEKPAEISRPRFAWLIENIPRRMRAHVSVEAEVKISTIAAEVADDPVGQGKTGLYGPEITQALSLQLSALSGGVLVEPQSPETQWVWRGKSQSLDELADWRFIITPKRRGSNILRLTFSYKEIGPSGLFADSALPDRMLEIFVSTNLPKTLTRAAVWVTTLIVGVTLGLYFVPAIQFIGRLYQ